MDTAKIRDAIILTLKDAVKGSEQILIDGWEMEAEEIAEDAAHYAVMASQGDAEAETLLLHLKVQAELVAARMVVAENEVLSATIESVLLSGVQILGIVLKGLA